MADELDYAVLSAALPPEVLEGLDEYRRGDIEALPAEFAVELLEGFAEGEWTEFCIDPGDREGDDRPWLVAQTHAFMKAATRLDAKMSKRVRKALVVIAEAPLTLRGNTVKPLANKLRGLWRYRLSDHRLIYRPEPAEREVLMLDIGVRGGIYDRA